MPLYRKTALVFAEQYLAGVHTPKRVQFNADGPFIETLEGPHQVREGDYICFGVADEIWNVERSIFEKTYEEVSTPGWTSGPPVKGATGLNPGFASGGYVEGVASIKPGDVPAILTSGHDLLRPNFPSDAAFEAEFERLLRSKSVEQLKDASAQAELEGDDLVELPLSSIQAIVLDPAPHAAARPDTARVETSVTVNVRPDQITAIDPDMREKFLAMIQKRHPAPGDHW